MSLQDQQFFSIETNSELRNNKHVQNNTEKFNNLYNKKDNYISVRNHLDNSNNQSNKVFEENENSESIIDDVENKKKRRNSESTNFNSLHKRKTRRKSSNDVSQDNESNANNPIIPVNQVESELEKMFAGIVEPNTEVEKQKEIGKNKIKTEDETIKDLTLNENMSNTEINMSTGKKTTKDNQKKQSCSKDSLKKQNSFGKPNKKSKDSINTELSFDNSNSITKSRGPLIHLKNKNDDPLKMQIINTFRDDEDDKNKEKRKLGNTFNPRSKRSQLQNNASYLGNSCGPKLYNITLSSKYDSQTADLTWNCTFCNKGPHYIIRSEIKPANASKNINVISFQTVLSDLFGPYMIKKSSLLTQNNVSETDDFQILDNKKDIKNSGKRKKGKFKGNSTVTNLSNNDEISQDNEDDCRLEVWLHEQCAVWTTGVYIKGGRIIGLEEAISDAKKINCFACGLTGANISCMFRGCENNTHYTCGIQAGWLFDLERFISKCQKHRTVLC